jgi:uncharacterized phage protein gp47/JayE
MPLTLRSKDDLLDTIISSILAGNIATDISHISVIRQLCEGLASTQADLGYDLYSLLQGWYITSAEGIDLDIRGLDYNLARDPGQAASDPVTFTAAATHIEDIPLPVPQVVLATLADGTDVLYRSLGNHVLFPSGRSVSGPSPGASLTSGINDQLAVNVDGDGVRTVLLGTQTTAVGIAAAIQAAVRALTALNAVHQGAYNAFRCDYGVTTTGVYTLRSGLAGPTSSVVVTPVVSANASGTLKLGLAQGGQERVGVYSLDVPVLCDTIGVLGNVGAGQINHLQADVPGIASVANPLMFSNGREPASDDAYRQDIRSHLKSLGPGVPPAIERAVALTVGADGQRHVMTAQVAYGVNTIQAYVCDGRSLIVGAQSDVIQDVQDELDGLGQTPGGWVPGGNVAGVARATILTVDVAVRVTVGPTPDLTQARGALANAIYQLLYTSEVGFLLSIMRLDSTIDSAVTEVFNIIYTLPAAFSTNPASPIGGMLGTKLMPGTIKVDVVRA